MSNPTIGATIAPTFELIGGELAVATAGKDGHLHLRFADGARLDVEADEAYEVWEVKADDFHLVGLAAGEGVAIWTDLVGPTISRLMLRTSDREALRRFYELLGLRFRAVVPSGEAKFLEAMVGSTRIQVLAANDDPAHGAARDTVLELAVRSVAEVHARLVEADVAVTPARYEEGLTVSVVDPDGRKVEVIDA